ncbi:MAG TPA: rhodanese-like domain-containing protein [Pyrinomonadaceae bacterium]|nr:rhodanese-like domain-containing protein [Pyrinomonadaceae bacterium]
MRLQKVLIAISLILLIAQTDASFGSSGTTGIVYAQTQDAKVEFLTASDLKSKVTQNQPVTIIDVRTTDAFADSSRKIKGAVHLKLRRLRYRLGFAPLNKVSRDSEVITYCSCPNDELSIKAAQVLRDSGFKRARVLKGGWREWLKQNGPVETIAKAP